ncbi:MAG: 5-methylthioadenosine/S-adenosylhomocysteine deaminase [Clostridia bacterium]|jgi:cytosine/adenosine deaminase-related metal-dependent hydrolase|nr:amidohydrolase family protein [Clostridiales bacterium]MDK2985602.1 5-methylthioadenosine/S-adenosylhomocysteine deaminase [Clostridia bacterium]
MSLLIKNATIVTMNSAREVFEGNVAVEKDRIAYVGVETPDADEVIDASGKLLIPGLIQTHIHLCQTLFRGQADDLELLDWLKLKIWPLEGSHTPESIYTSALLGCGELFKGGTTSIVDMGTVHYTDEVITAIKETGMRAIVGKAMMDHGDDVPDALSETTEDSLQESIDLLEKWNGAENGRITYAFTPRFAVSCSDKLLREVAKLARQYDVPVHTHASENRGEIELVQKERGMRNVVYLDDVRLTDSHLLLAHCIWLDEQEMNIIQDKGVHVLHCPSCNLKLSSGIAKIPEMLEKGISVSIGADGAPCNNNLDMFKEMHLAALIQKPLHGPTVMPARKIFEIATLGGAKAMGMENQIGSIEVGKKADLALVSLQGLHCTPTEEVDVYSQLVYQCKSSDVVMTMVDGRIVMKDRVLTTIEEETLAKRCNEQIKKVKKSAGIM